MPSYLSDLQSWMQTALVAPKKEHIIPYIHKHISPAKELTAMQSLAIYQRSYYSRLIECMQGQFKALAYTLGDDLFEDFCKMYLTEHPSNSASLANLGDRFPAFLDVKRPDEETPELWIDFMISMAKFEVDLYRIFDIKGSEGAVFADVTTNDEFLKMQLCVDFQEYPFDVNTYYQKVSNEESPEITEASKTHILFLRHNYQVYVIPLGHIQFNLLKAIRDEENVTKGLSKTATDFNIPLDYLYNDWIIWRRIWIQKGVFLNE